MPMKRVVAAYVRGLATRVVLAREAVRTVLKAVVQNINVPSQKSSGSARHLPN